MYFFYCFTPMGYFDCYKLFTSKIYWIASVFWFVTVKHFCWLSFQSSKKYYKYYKVQVLRINSKLQVSICQRSCSFSSSSASSFSPCFSAARNLENFFSHQIQHFLALFYLLYTSGYFCLHCGHSTSFGRHCLGWDVVVVLEKQCFTGPCIW